MTWRYKYDEKKRLFWEHLVQRESFTKLRGHKKEAYVLFCALDAAYSSTSHADGFVPVYRELVQYLAGWGRDSTEHGELQGGVLEPGANHFLKRAYSGFFETVCTAAKEGDLRQYDDHTLMYGGLEIPQWLADMCRAEAEEDAEHIHQMEAAHPSMRRRPHLVHPA